MLRIRYVVILLVMLFFSTASAAVRVSIGIGINVPAYPELVVVPGYPVYYAPRMEANFFFYDGLYWVYQDDNWYESSWYNGPWWLVYPEDVPLFILRIPVRYYRLPPAYFIGWQFNAPPRWGDHWGHDWDQRRGGWDRWNRSSAPAPAPLPTYQRQYSGDRYPRQVEQQQELRQQNYRYQPHDPVVRKQYQEQSVPRAPAQQEKSQQERQRGPEDRGFKQQDNQRSVPLPQTTTPRQNQLGTPRVQSPQNGGFGVQRPIPTSPQQGRPEVQAPREQSQQGAVPRPQSPQKNRVDVQKPPPAPLQQGRFEDQVPRPQNGQGTVQSGQQKPRPQQQKERQQSNDTPSEPKQGQGQDRGKDRNE